MRWVKLALWVLLGAGIIAGAVLLYLWVDEQLGALVGSGGMAGMLLSWLRGAVRRAQPREPQSAPDTATVARRGADEELALLAEQDRQREQQTREEVIRAYHEAEQADPEDLAARVDDGLLRFAGQAGLDPGDEPIRPLSADELAALRAGGIPGASEEDGGDLGDGGQGAAAGAGAAGLPAEPPAAGGAGDRADAGMPPAVVPSGSDLAAAGHGDGGPAGGDRGWPAAGALIVPTRAQVVAIALGAADRDWRLPVIDRKGQRGLDRIDEMIRSTQRGLGWTWLRPYTPQSYQWCGAAVGAWYAEAGLHLLWRERCCSSVERLEAWARYRSYVAGWSHPTRCKMPDGTEMGLRDLHRATGGERLLQHVRPNKPLEWIPQPGDIALVGPEDEGHPHGKHVTLIVEWAGSYTRTIEGNAGGTLPDGSRIPDGVVRACREPAAPGLEKAYTIRTLIRPALADFLPGLELL